MEEKKPVTHVPGTIHVPYRYSLGPYWTRFSISTKNNQIMGTKCHKCGSVYVPPQHFCTLCYIDVRDWVEVQDTGVAMASTVVYLPYPGQPKTPPYVFSQIKLDGASTIIWHVVDGIEFDKVRARMPVKAVWREQRKGDFSDIEYFKPIEDETAEGG
jgi:uncharacterized OB-fold protein